MINTNLNSAPVGYMTIVDMYPLDFEEFLQIVEIDPKIIESLRQSLRIIKYIQQLITVLII